MSNPSQRPLGLCQPWLMPMEHSDEDSDAGSQEAARLQGAGEAVIIRHSNHTWSPTLLPHVRRNRAHRYQVRRT